MVRAKITSEYKHLWRLERRGSLVRMVVGALRRPIPVDPRLKRPRPVVRGNAGGMFDPCEDHLWGDGTELVIDALVQSPPAPGQFVDDGVVARVRLAAVESEAEVVEQDEIIAWRVERALEEYVDAGIAPDDTVHDHAQELADLEAAIDDGRGTPAIEDRAWLLRVNGLMAKGGAR